LERTIGQVEGEDHRSWDTINLGLYSTPEEAYESYCEAAKDYYGEFARL